MNSSHTETTSLYRVTLTTTIELLAESAEAAETMVRNSPELWDSDVVSVKAVLLPDEAQP